jgi:hypothetical protein
MVGKLPLDVITTSWEIHSSASDHNSDRGFGGCRPLVTAVSSSMPD